MIGSSQPPRISTGCHSSQGTQTLALPQWSLPSGSLYLNKSEVFGRGWVQEHLPHGLEAGGTRVREENAILKAPDFTQNAVKGSNRRMYGKRSSGKGVRMSESCPVSQVTTALSRPIRSYIELLRQYVHDRSHEHVDELMGRHTPGSIHPDAKITVAGAKRNLTWACQIARRSMLDAALISSSDCWGNSRRFQKNTRSQLSSRLSA